uniref:Putative archaeal/vacuolar-type h+-atpase subunit i energy production and conversion n=1 Tax=Culex tarsalis TaxID=7177 RepID=A0A1Q3F9W2_CULTA
MDVSQGSPESTSPSRNTRSSIPIPKRKSSLHLYIANSFGNNSQSSPSPSSASSVHEDAHSASSSRSATAMGMHSSMYVPGRTAAAVSAHAQVDPVSSSDYLQLRENHNRLINKCEEVTRRNQNLESTNQLLKKSVTALQKDVAALRKERSEFVDKNRKLKKKLAEIVPSGTISSCSDDDEGTEKSLEDHTKDDSAADPVEASKKESELDSLLNEMEKLKSYLNNVELQLYEANEKISELQESKQQYEETSEKLRAENAELSKIARLMSANILESIDTSKRLETSYIQVRRERDNLARQNRDSVDSVGHRTDATEEIQKMRSEMELKRKTFEAQFIEYKQQMEQELLRQTDERVVTLQLEVDRLKQDLAEALDRAERAEEEARELRTLLRASQLHQNQQFYSQLDLDKLSLHDLGGGDNDSLTSGISNSASAAAAPPPPPPPLPPPPPPPPPPGTTMTGAGTLGLSEAISTQKLNHVGINPVNNKQQATGLDSVIADIKSGRVTLRRRKPNVLSELENAAGSGSGSTKTSNSSRQSNQQPNYSQLAAQNPALREMYEILERMKRRNRQSKVIVESEIVGGSGGAGSGDATDGRTVRTVITGIVDL